MKVYKTTVITHHSFVSMWDKMLSPQSKNCNNATFVTVPLPGNTKSPIYICVNCNPPRGPCVCVLCTSAHTVQKTVGLKSSTRGTKVDFFIFVCRGKTLSCIFWAEAKRSLIFNVLNRQKAGFCDFLGALHMIWSIFWQLRVWARGWRSGREYSV